MLKMILKWNVVMQADALASVGIIVKTKILDI